MASSSRPGSGTHIVASSGIDLDAELGEVADRASDEHAEEEEEASEEDQEQNESSEEYDSDDTPKATYWDSCRQRRSNSEKERDRISAQRHSLERRSQARQRELEERAREEAEREEEEPYQSMYPGAVHQARRSKKRDSKRSSTGHDRTTPGVETPRAEGRARMGKRKRWAAMLPRWYLTESDALDIMEQHRSNDEGPGDTNKKSMSR